MPEFTPRSMRARAHARKPLGALSPNVAAPTGGAKAAARGTPVGRPCPSARRRRASTRPVSSAPPCPRRKTRRRRTCRRRATSAPAARGKARTSSQPPPPVGARRASSLPPDYATEQPSIAGLAGTPIYDELAQQERTRRALSVALYAAQSEGRRLAARWRARRERKSRRGRRLTKTRRTRRRSPTAARRGRLGGALRGSTSPPVWKSAPRHRRDIVPVTASARWRFTP